MAILKYQNAAKKLIKICKQSIKKSEFINRIDKYLIKQQKVILDDLKIK